jgi:hypothetical protein
MDRWLRVITVFLLLAILVVQVMILRRSPTLGELRNARDKRAVLLRQPLVQVRGGPVDVNLDQPIDVNVENQPIEVSVSQ